MRRLIFIGSQGQIANEQGVWDINSNPVLSFSFDGIIFDSANHNYFKLVGNGRTRLTESEIGEITAYIDAQIPPAVVQPTRVQLVAQLKNEVLDAVKLKLDAEARVLGYDSFLTACVLASVTNAHQNESKTFINWYSAIRTIVQNKFTGLENGNAPLPTKEEVLALLPKRI